jgi:hypothetical protein
MTMDETKKRVVKFAINTVLGLTISALIGGLIKVQRDVETVLDRAYPTTPLNPLKKP